MFIIIFGFDLDDAMSDILETVETSEQRADGDNFEKNSAQLIEKEDEVVEADPEGLRLRASAAQMVCTISSVGIGRMRTIIYCLDSPIYF